MRASRERRSTLGMKVGAAALASVAATILALAPGASAASGSLDRGFGDGGKAMIAAAADQAHSRGTYSFSQVWASWAGGGKVLVAGNGWLVELRGDGRPDPGFGDGGAVPILTPEPTQSASQQTRPPTEPEVGLAVDSRGRILVAGTEETDPQQPIQFPLGRVVIERFLPDGQPDPSFGEGGIVKTTFGFPPVQIPLGWIHEGEAPFESAYATGLAVDGHDRPIVTGRYLNGWQGCYPSWTEKTTGSFVARLTTGGAPDPSFAGTGIVAMDDLENIEDPQVDGRGVVTAVTQSRIECQRSYVPEITRVRLTPGGAVNTAYSSRPALPSVSGLVETTTDDRGRLVVLSGGAFGVGRDYSVRLWHNGSLDRSFGRDGTQPLLEANRHLAVAAVGGGSLLFAGVAAGLDGSSETRRFYLERRLESGTRDREFGKEGFLTTGFGGAADAVATAILVGGGGKMTVAGSLTSPRLAGGEGFALARYLGPPRSKHHTGNHR